MASYQEFKNMVLNNAYDIDGYYGAQCWDGFAKYCQYLGYPIFNCTTSGYVKDIWNNRATSGILNYFTEVSIMQPGDVAVFMESASTPYSHIAIFDSDVGNGYGRFLGQNQGGANGAFNIIQLPYSATFATAFRPKSFGGGTVDPQPGGYPITDTGAFMFTVDNVNIRNGMSGLAGALTGLQYNSGEVVYYDTVYESDGYLWISYVSYSGVRRSVAVRDKDGTMWGHNV